MLVSLREVELSSTSEGLLLHFRFIVRMIAGYHPVLQALLGTLFTWALTAAGSALVFVFSKGQVST